MVIRIRFHSIPNTSCNRRGWRGGRLGRAGPAGTTSTWPSTEHPSNCRAAAAGAACAYRRDRTRSPPRPSSARAPVVPTAFIVETRSPGVTQISIAGRSTPPDRVYPTRRLLVCSPASTAEEEPCARKVLATVATRAYRRPVAEASADVSTLLEFYRAGRTANGETAPVAFTRQGFESGIQRALARVLVDPQFLFRFERAPADVAPGSAYRLPDLELASRLSFFLWSSMPDDELLDVARRGALKDPATLERQVRRMLADPARGAGVELRGAVAVPPRAEEAGPLHGTSTAICASRFSARPRCCSARCA